MHSEDMETTPSGIGAKIREEDETRRQQLTETIRRVREDLEAEPEMPEAQVRRVAIEPILSALGWSNARTECRSEYPLPGKGRVDYAIGDFSRTVPQICGFIECKRPGAVDPKGEAQLFGYAATEGIVHLVLTDGREWHFYLAMAGGPPEERRFKELDLLEDEPTKTAGALWKYLSKQRVLEEEARREAEEELGRTNAKRMLEQHLPQVWKTLIENPSARLVQAVDERLVSEVPERLLPGTRSREEGIKGFLRSMGSQHAGTPRPAKTVRTNRVECRERGAASAPPAEVSRDAPPRPPA